MVKFTITERYQKYEHESRINYISNDSIDYEFERMFCAYGRAEPWRTYGHTKPYVNDDVWEKPAGNLQTFARFRVTEMIYWMRWERKFPSNNTKMKIRDGIFYVLWLLEINNLKLPLNARNSFVDLISDFPLEGVHYLSWIKRQVTQVGPGRITGLDMLLSLHNEKVVTGGMFIPTAKVNITGVVYKLIINVLSSRSRECGC